MTTRRRNLVLLALVLLLGVAGAFFVAPAGREEAAVEAVPSGAFLVITLDLTRLRASPLAHDLGDLREVSDVATLCGFDPLAHARAVAIGVPEKPDGVFGLAITNDLSRDDLARCAERVMSARSATASITQHGSWTVVEQKGLLEANRPKIAYRDGAPLLVGRGDYLRTMQAAVDGETTRAVDGPKHASLRKRATARGGPDTVLVATALLPQSVRDRIRDEMSDEAGSSESKRKTMAAILSVSAVSVSLASQGENLDVFAELDCETADTCATVRDFLDRKRKSVADQPGARFVGIGALLDALRIEARGTSLVLSLAAPETEVVRAVRAAFSAAYAPPAPPPPAPSASGFSPRR
jgi:hypothetical protein